MSEGAQKIGLTKPTVFAAVNGNTPSHSSNNPPAVIPKFKISRGTQANVSVPKNVTKFSPPVPAKPAALSKQPRSPAPPVPPKPGSALKSPLKPAVAPKPILPPKPLVRPCKSGSVTFETTVPPNVPIRNRGEQSPRADQTEKSIPMYEEKVPISSAHLVVKQSRKSASLGRLEGVRCCAMLVKEGNERCLQRDSGFISCSLENVEQPAVKLTNQRLGFPFSSIPIAPPRRRRKSVESYEPIYAVIDFSKKRNRRMLLAQEQAARDNLHQPIVQNADKDIEASPVSLVEKDKSVPTTPSVCSVNEDETSVPESPALEMDVSNSMIATSEMDSDIQIIENSFATIASLFENINDTGDSVPVPSRPTLTRESEDVQEDSSSSSNNQQEEETTTAGQAVIARLVFGGTVVQQTDILPTMSTNDNRRKRTKEFCTALKDVIPSTGFDLLTDTVSVRERKINLREPSPTPSASSNSSSDSKEDEFFPGKHFDPDVVSCGSLGDVDTSDATRQNSVDDEIETAQMTGNASTSVDGKERRNSFGLRRTLDTLFTSLSNKSGIRKAAEKRKTLDFDSSSTDTDSITAAPRPHIFISRPAPPQPSHKFNRGDRAYRSVQPPEKGRSKSIDGSLVEKVDRRHVSLSPVISSPEPVAAQQGQIVNLDQPESSSSASTHNYANEPGLCLPLMEQNSDRTRACLPDGSSSEMEKDIMYRSLEGKERKAYMTAKEIASSERVFVDCLRLICDDFRQAVKDAAIGSNGRDTLHPVIPEAELNKILNYLPQLQNLNHELLNDFELRLKNWSTQPKIADVIVRKGPFLKLYSAYIRDFQSQSAQLEECIQKYPRFAKVLKQFEQSGRCKSLSLKHYMLKPVQRLPQYRLLLEVYLRHLNENSPDYHDTLVALKVVTDVAEHANNSMKQEDNFQRLIHLQSRLGNCEIIKPGRYIIKEGELDKVSRKMLQPRYFILLNDCLLYTSYLSSPSPNCSLKLHHELPLSRMEVHLPSVSATEENANEFNVISTARSFTLAASSMHARNEWMCALSEAISELQSKQSTFPSKMPTDNGEFRLRLGQQAPVWIPDSRVTMCQLCTAAFSITFRRHHCRACGKVVCRSCSTQKAGLEYLKFRSARVCDDCFQAINEHEGSVNEDGMDSSNCSSLIETDLSASLVNVPPVCFVHAFNDEVTNRRHPSDSVGQPTSQAGLKAQQVKRDAVRKERRYVPPRLMEVPANDAGSQISGYLSRRARRSWKRNWFVLKDRVLYIYKASEDVVALDTIPVLGYQVQTFQEVAEDNEHNQFQLFHPKQSPIVFHAENAILAKKWIEALSSATVL
ncbi:FYVE, RhoGEF and PH domain-containing protein 5-like [Daphnia carinata]|uniref:FYVE, RhoGEF and PH domain-containing protein 5-like n=1 Tax=Daphnia carinata TaxID=120202 RepID=UPI0025808D7D|nr:FYVE, RhoGEF and PH domain-containing protein 5-like [Daphnia carinata]XP_059350190.1 FYVE, RhoGEF and PH domain-containing protein 5-like [Daphnia carinata]